MSATGHATTHLPEDFPAPGEAARKRAALELIKCHEQTLRRTARRYSLCADDADDAYQRALVILLTKAPTEDPRQLIRWMQTVTKHEALAVRRNRERLLGPPGPARDEDGTDPIQLIPSERAGPADLAERRERAARSREALQSLKPQELRALTLLAEGYSYREICAITGWTRTKVNRCLAEGRARFREVISASESGGRCDELSGALSAFCDGEADARDAALLREHLRACAHCRATLRAFRAAPGAAALMPGGGRDQPARSSPIGPRRPRVADHGPIGAGGGGDLPGERLRRQPRSRAGPRPETGGDLPGHARRRRGGPRDRGHPGGDRGAEGRDAPGGDRAPRERCRAQQPACGEARRRGAGHFRSGRRPPGARQAGQRGWPSAAPPARARDTATTAPRPPAAACRRTAPPGAAPAPRRSRRRTSRTGADRKRPQRRAARRSPTSIRRSHRAASS